MSVFSSPVGAALPAKSKLFLVFQCGQQRFALAATQVAEVLPVLPLKPIARAPAWVAGVFAHRGHIVPVIDVGALAFDQPAVARTSTRLVLVHYRTEQNPIEPSPIEPGPTDHSQATVTSDPGEGRSGRQPQALLGLILEQATNTLRCDPAQFQAYGLNNTQAPYLGPVREDAQGLLQWVRVQDLLDDQARALLYAPALADAFAPGEPE
jgi:chemotaxis-related protein WspB